ncbi:hypothetical protein [Actinacidiphila glaucinigra]|uniref:hypothetical protein n=1 Tax=Actinacidiphila glaucinigra TaxID=235986 RepID=UPI0035D7A722
MPLLRSLALTATSAALATVVAAAPASAAVGSPAPRAAPTHATVLVTCFGRGLVMPPDFLLACGDGNDRLGGLYWSHWAADSAVATGYEEANDCDPYCAAGHFHTFPVKITLSDSKPWPGDPGLRHFTKLTISYPDTEPSWPHDPVRELWD